MGGWGCRQGGGVACSVALHVFCKCDAGRRMLWVGANGTAVRARRPQLPPQACPTTRTSKSVIYEECHVPPPSGLQVAAQGLFPNDKRPDPPSLRTTVWGRDFRNPIGTGGVGGWGVDRPAGRSSIAPQHDAHCPLCDVAHPHGLLGRRVGWGAVGCGAGRCGWVGGVGGVALGLGEGRCGPYRGGRPWRAEGEAMGRADAQVPTWPAGLLPCPPKRCSSPACTIPPPPPAPSAAPPAPRSLVRAL